MISFPNNAIRLSKFMSFVLRHKPENFGLAPNPHGFVAINDLLIVLQNRYGNVQLSDVEKVVQDCPKKRFEIKGEKIRARYGHSIDVTLDQEPSEPPSYLYHGTSPSAMNVILTEGLQPMRRRYIHLSKTKEEAFAVGKRKSKNPIVFIVKAKEAYQKGVEFYDMGVMMLTQAIPAEFVQLSEEPIW